MATILTTGSATATASNTLVPSAAPATGRPQPLRAEAVAHGLQQVQEAIGRLKQSIKPALANKLEFQIDESTGRTLIKVLDTETNTVVRQIPSEEIMAIAHAIDRMQGRGGLIRQQA